MKDGYIKKSIIIEISSEVYKKFKNLCTNSDISIKEMMEKFIVDLVKKQEDKK